ncbi:MAG: UDP-N-acetylmuramoyl-tripeptide--D-alanyl-D-alanine ligase [Dehalococcoidia bacterium]
MTALRIDELTEAADGLLIARGGPAGGEFQRAVIDSREAGPGDLFFALRGERHDGHEFVGQALGRGATGLVVERPLAVPDGITVLHVNDSLTALQRLAARRRESRPDLRVIGVTGSVGKTTCKELIAAVLGARPDGRPSGRFRVLKSEANLNTEIGLPLTLLRLEEGHERAVLEMAMYAPGEIDLLCHIARPQIGVVTNVSSVHLERLGSMGAIATAKAELVEALPPDGVAVLNGDDPRVTAMAARTKARAILYGRSEQCDVRAGEVEGRGLDGISFRLSHGGSSVAVEMPLPGRHHVYPGLAAAAVALAEGMTLEEIGGALREARPELRLRVLTAPAGYTIIDDTYNASPPAMIAALDLLSDLPGRRVALLGEMRELGDDEADGHRRVGERAAACADLVLVVGERARPLYEAAASGQAEARYLDSVEAATSALRDELRPGDHLLVKASRAVGLESVVEALVKT